MICGIIASSEELIVSVRGALVDAFGEIDVESAIIPFDMTTYYEPQMGAELLRYFVGFEEIVSPQELAGAKVRTNEIEAEFARASANGGSGRPVNLDPGLVTEASIILASMKNFAHRIYLSQGVYGEVTLMFHKGGWSKLPWTFPDYGSGRYDEFLTMARDMLRQRKRS